MVRLFVPPFTTISTQAEKALRTLFGANLLPGKKVEILETLQQEQEEGPQEELKEELELSALVTDCVQTAAASAPLTDVPVIFLIADKKGKDRRQHSMKIQGQLGNLNNRHQITVFRLPLNEGKLERIRQLLLDNQVKARRKKTHEHQFSSPPVGTNGQLARQAA